MARKKHGHRDERSWRRKQRTNASYNYDDKPGDPPHRNELPKRSPKGGARTQTGVEAPTPLTVEEQSRPAPGYRPGRRFLGTSDHHHPYDPPGYHEHDRGPAKARHGMSTRQQGGQG